MQKANHMQVGTKSGSPIDKLVAVMPRARGASMLKLNTNTE